MSAPTKHAADMVEILIAEDSPTQAEQLRYLLEQHHYNVTVACDGRQALALLGEHKPALVISDIVMPEMDGYELCQRIKEDESTQDIPVILLTTLSNPEDVLEGLACGADNFITKPYSEEYFLLHIEQILANKKLTQNERVRVGVEILFAGKRRFITANQQQMLTLLISTYEAAVHRNAELVEVQNELSALNEHLEDLVEERTAALMAEIAERKRVEQEIEALARFPSENVNPVLRIARDGKLLYVNEAGLSQLQEWHLQAGQPMPSVLWEAVSKALDSGATLVFDLEQGERVYAFSAVPFVDAGYANLYGRDTTERRQAEEALASERSLLRTLVDHLPIAVYVKDVACRKTLANPVDFYNMGAASEAEVLGKTDFDLFPPDLAALFHADDQRVIQSGQPILDREEVVTRPDGTRGWQLTSKVPVRDGAGQVVGLVGIGHDITARKQAEEVLQLYTEQLQAMVEHRTRELREAQEQLLRQEKLATLGQIAGTMAHELNNPLGGINNAAYFVKLALGQPEPEVAEALEIMEREVATCARIVNSLLEFTRTSSPDRREVDLNDVLQEALSRAAVPAHIAVVCQLDSRLPPVLADPSHLCQVFDSILLNAIQAMSPPYAVQENGRLAVESRTLDPEWVVVSIADTGAGIAEENLTKIFEPLFTTKAKGAGLGLSLAKALVEGHSGSIRVSSAVGKGSTFTVRLPIG